MPAAVLGPAIGAAAGLGGALLQKKSADKANKAQEASSAEAIALQREQMAMEKAQYEQRQRQLEPFRRRTMSLFAKYGIPTGMPTEPRTSLGAMADMPTRPPIAIDAASAMQGDAMTPNPLAIKARGMNSLANLQNWSNWNG